MRANRTVAPTATGSGRVVIDIPAEGDAAIRATVCRGTPIEVTVECAVTADEARQMCAAIADLLAATGSGGSPGHE